MKNSSFLFKTEEEKSVKLIALLRRRCRDRLTEEQLTQLTLAVRTGRQYFVKVHVTPSDFCQSLVLVKSDADNDTGTIVFGQALFGAATEFGYREGCLFQTSQQACAVISRKRMEHGRIQFSNEIHIYIPSSLYEKGNHLKYGQKQKATFGI